MCRCTVIVLQLFCDLEIISNYKFKHKIKRAQKSQSENLQGGIIGAVDDRWLWTADEGRALD